MTDLVRILFRLAQDEDGFPPVEVETIWAKPVSESQFQIDNIPFYVQGISLGDIVAAVDIDGLYTFTNVLSLSENSTVHIFVLSVNDRKKILNCIENCGCDYEIANPDNLIAVNIPSEADAVKLLRYLESCSSDGKLEFQESAPRYSGDLQPGL